MGHHYFMPTDLTRFVEAQEGDYQQALSEIRAGRKRSHWMWYIFPQLRGLGHSSMAQRYAIRDLDEATVYLGDSVLGPRLVEISQALLGLSSNDATAVMGKPDDLKLWSCMTLFSLVGGADPVFVQVLEKFYGGRRDERTVSMV
jgi:uncharacterized protein (DUF1810 family)